MKLNILKGQKFVLLKRQSTQKLPCLHVSQNIFRVHDKKYYLVKCKHM